jgi:gliding motility-associated-like protein
MLVLNLQINTEFSFDTTVSSCDQYSWPVNQQVFNQSGTFVAPYSTIYGCDSIYTLHLSISPTYLITESQTACDSFQWVNANDILTNSGTYVRPFRTTSGCDSIHTLNLSVYPSYAISVLQHSCEPYLWEETGKAYATSGTFTKLFKTAAGCDSIRLLQLTVDTPVIVRDTVLARETYYWKETSLEYAKEGEYEARYSAVSGCDSIQYLVLRLLNVTYPNIFSPNGDEVNGWFTIYGNSLLKEITQLDIYDRWGNLVFNKYRFLPNRPDLGWNGSFAGVSAATGVYTFVALLTLDGLAPEWISGSITLVR